MGFTLDFDLERLASPPRKVDVDEDDDSRTGARPRGFELPFVCRLRFGLGCFVREVTRPGEADDMEVGVELTLNGPGEYPVDGVDDDNA